MENGWNTEVIKILLWNVRTECGLHAIIVQIELEMCINFALSNR